MPNKWHVVMKWAHVGKKCKMKTKKEQRQSEDLGIFVVPS
jgi:hypothetical protein